MATSAQTPVRNDTLLRSPLRTIFVWSFVLFQLPSTTMTAADFSHRPTRGLGDLPR
ncbi:MULTISPECIES: hypothetical protein [Snuella]|uniref:Uncharacterized protein n=1 Tax=Snuella sedimenti TaxID=2798802 RepID=A0A8J7IFL0_9FLAO|nr:hypothetical protein [Snuella sedimenti]MBJ6367982.1 hypothetical protein [Snuella sedimenti]